MEEEQSRFLESSDSDIKKLIANAVPEITDITRKSTKYAINVLEGEKSHEQT